MRNQLVVLFLTCVAPAALLASQSSSSSAPQTAPPAAQAASKTPATLTGCLTQDDHGGPFIVTDAKNGTYRVTGVEAKPYVGKRVQVKGSSQGLHIAGGLWPSPNVAAQAGDIDQVQAANAAKPGGAAHGIGPELPREFVAKSLRAVKGSCP